MAEIFLSYCSADRDVALKLVDALTAEGISVWWDDRLTPVEQWDRSIEKEIKLASAVLVIWTRHAVESDWVRVEADFGRRNKKLLQARLEKCDVPLQFTLIQWLDVDAWLASGNSAELKKLILWFRALTKVSTEVVENVQASPALPLTTSSDTDHFAQALADMALEAAHSGSGSYDDNDIPELGHRWPAFITNYRLDFTAIADALRHTPTLRAKLVESGLHLSLYFMMIRDEYQSFASLGLAMKAIMAANSSEIAGFLPSLRSIARIAIESIEPESVTHYALGRMLGATTWRVCKVAPELVRQQWVAATAITLSAYGGKSHYLTSGFREMSGNAGYSVEIVHFDLPEVGASFASALLDDSPDEGFSRFALKRFTALKETPETR